MFCEMLLQLAMDSRRVTLSPIVGEKVLWGLVRSFSAKVRLIVYLWNVIVVWDLSFLEETVCVEITWRC
jgi:hypothetical protein